MGKETYTDKLKVRIGRVQASAVVSDYFPIVGSNVTIDVTTKWGQSAEWRIQDGNGQTDISAADLLMQSATRTFNITGAGELVQRFVALNSLSDTVVQKNVYSMQAQTLPYFEVEVSKEIIRADGEPTQVRIRPEYGYIGAHTAVVRVYKENEEVIPASSFTNFVQADGYIYCEFFTSTPDDRGIYDVEVDVIDTASGKTFTKRINKLVTVTPRLAPEPSDRESGYRDIFATKSFTSYNGMLDFHIRLWENTGYGLSYAELQVPSGEQNGTAYYDSIDISQLPAGTTLVLKDDPLEPSGYVRRLLFKGNNPVSVSNASGTPANTYVNPLVITVNQDTPYHVPFQFYSGLSFDANCRHIVLDGRGYKNIIKGIHIHKYSPDVFGETCIFLLNGTSDVELLELELSDCDFTAIMGKTDPDISRPWYWFGNWEMTGLWLHHCHIHDTVGEGFYIGYFTPETKKNGELTYRAHALRNTRIFRNKLNHLGYDGIQLSNARNAEVCYNEIYDAAYRGDKDQCSGMSIQSMSGKCYNNVVHKFNGPGLQVGPLGDMEIFNNIVYDCPDGQPGVQFLFSNDTPEQNPNGDAPNDIIKMYVHNNVLICNGVAFNGRNTVQILGLYTEDNIIVYKSAIFGNMAADTLVKWAEQASGNLFIKQSVIDFVEIDSNKIADSANGNYQLASDSPLIQSGTGSKFKFDFRGYKNWFGTVAPTGAYMGLYKTANVNDEPVSLTSVSINNGDAATKIPAVQVKLVYTGAAVRYRIGETADLSGAVWINLPEGGMVEYTLSVGFSQKTVYAQVGAGSAVSDVKSATIDYQSTPLSLDGFTVNNGMTASRHLTVPVSFTYSGSFAPVKYRIGETADLSGAVWTDYAQDITYTFDSLGQKTVYGQLQDTDGNVSGIKSAGISIEHLAPKSIVSLGWITKNIPINTPGLSVLDSDTGITRFQSEAAINLIRTIYDTTGEAMGTAVPSTIMCTNDVTKGTVSGDDSGVFPDIYLENNSSISGNKLNLANITFVIPAGIYKVRLLCNTLWAGRVIPNDGLLYKAVTDTDDVAITLPTTGVQNNISTITEAVMVTVGESGMLKIVFGISGVRTDYYYAPLNIIEIEEV